MQIWLREQLNRVSRDSALAKAIRYGLRHWVGLGRFLTDGRLELDTNIVEREIRPVDPEAPAPPVAPSRAPAPHPPPRARPPSPRLDLAQPREQIVLDRHAFSTPAHGKDYLARRSAKIKAGQTLSTTDRVGQTAVTNNAAERRMRPLGRKNYLFAGSLEGGRRAAIIYTLVGTADLNGWNPQAYLRVLLERIADHPINRIGDLAPWNLQHETI